MSLAIRLSRGGAKKRPYYRIVVANSRSPRDGKFLEKIGTYDPLAPKDSPERVRLDTERAAHWLGVGAQPTDRVARFLDAAGLRPRPARPSSGYCAPRSGRRRRRRPPRRRLRPRPKPLARTLPPRPAARPRSPAVRARAARPGARVPGAEAPRPRPARPAPGAERLPDAAPPDWPAGERAVVLAVIAGAHGVRGEVRIRRFTQTPEGLTRHPWLWAGARPLRLLGLRPGAHGEIARLAGIATRDDAEALRGAELAVPRSALPPHGEGEVYVADLIGLPVRVAGEVIGHVAAVPNYGAGDLVEIVAPDGRSWLAPLARCAPEGDGLAVDPAFLA